jgi:predicted O-methyltransferase YrrM
MNAPYRPFSQEELFARFHANDSSSKHLLVLYSLVVGLNAKVIVDFGLGQTTGAIRTAAAVTGGTVHTCDFDKRRFEPILAEQDDRWRLYLEPSSAVIPKVPAPIDFVMHDGAHDYTNVKQDLEGLLPKMRKFGIICVHDTQQPDLSREMLAAIGDASANFAVSITNLPFSAGMAIIRVEESAHPAISPSSGVMPDGRSETAPATFATVPVTDHSVSQAKARMTAAKLKVGHLLRQAGLKS